MAFTSVAALFAGSVGTATILGAITEIGVALTVVGAVTGSKDLMKLGSVMGIVGGVGGLVTSAASAATTAASTAAEAASAPAASAASTAASTVSSTADGLSGMDMAADAGMGSYGGAVAAPIAQDAVQASNLGPIGTDATSAATNFTPPPVSATAVTAPTVSPVSDPLNILTPADTAGNIAPSAVQTPFSSSVIPVTPAGTPVGGMSGMDMQGDAGMAAYGPGPGTPSGSYFSKFSDFANKNKTLLDTGLKYGFGAIKGAADGQVAQARIDLARQQAAFGNSVSTYVPTLPIRRV